jgi:serine/threonine-protein kinase
VHEPAEAGVLATIGQTIGAVPRVLLRDTNPGEEPGPVVTPVSLAAGGAIRYRIDGEIARGGMGTVLKGRDPDLGRDVALKVLRDDYRDDATMVRRFVEEAQIGGQLQHPGIVPIYELGTLADRRPFFAMKLVKGRTLAELLAQRSDPAAELPRQLAIFEAVCQTMAYAHARSVIHRDLKPSNVMVGSFGEVQVMDWGVAKVLPRGGVVDDASAGKVRDETVIATARSGSDAEEAALSRAGSVLGTPSYMAPEQARGEVEQVDQRADVFALGSILCEVLTGVPAFTGRSSAAILRKAALGDTSEALRCLESCGADPELIGLAQDCLMREREDRPHDAGAVSERMTAYLSGVQARLHAAELAHAAEVARTEEARATAAQERKAREEAQARAVAERRTRRLTGALAATVLLALTVGGGGSLWVKHERDARQARVARDVNEALNQVSALRAQASSASTGGATLFAQARGHAQRALALIESSPADALLAAQVRRIQAALDQEEKDRTLLAALDEARLKQAESNAGEDWFAPERAVPLFREALREYGLPVGEGDPKAAARRIRSRPPAVREAIVAALDEWDELASYPSLHITERHRPWLRAVLAAAEPDTPWSQQVRAARAEQDEARRRMALEKLAASADVTQLPAQALARLGQRLEPAPRLALLRRAQRQYAGDFWVNTNLAGALASATPAEPDAVARFLTAAAALRPESPVCLFHLGFRLWHKGELDDAIACYRKAIALDPNYYRAHIDLGNVLRSKGELDQGIASYRKAIALRPQYYLAHLNLGAALGNKGELDEAIVCYRKAIALNPKHFLAHYDLGAALQDKGERDEAIACYRKAIELDPKVALVHNALGFALQAKGELDEAIACYRKAIELDPTNAKAHQNLVTASMAQGKLDRVVDEYREMIRRKPDDAETHYALGSALSEQGKHDGAIDEFRATIRLQPGRADAHAGLGHSLRVLGKLDEAIEEFHAAIRIQPDNASAHNNLGRALRTQGKRDEAIDAFRAAIRISPDYTVARNNLGLALRAEGKHDEAMAEFAAAIRNKPGDGRALSRLVSDLIGQGAAGDAEAVCREAIRVKPDAARAHYNLGLALDAQGKPGEAIAAYREAIRFSPKEVDAHFRLGNALQAKGQVDEAIACYGKAIDVDPKYALARTQLAKAQRLAAARDKLPAFQDGSYMPASNAECLDLAEWCRIRELHGAATRLYAKAFAAQPRLAAVLGAGHRYNAACSAALAAAGKGEEAATLDAAERAHLRKQGLDWLRADLAERTRQLDSRTPSVRASASTALLRWQQDPDLAGIRDPEALAQLPDGERNACEALWAAVQALVDRAQKTARWSPQDWFPRRP